MKNTFFEWLELWLNTYKKYTIKPSTYARYEFCIAHFADAEFALDEINLVYLQSKVNEWHMEGLSRSSIRQCIVCAREAIRKAVVCGQLDTGAAALCDLLELPRSEPRAVGAYSPFEVRRISERLTLFDEHERLFAFLLYTGVRVGEALALRRSDLRGHDITISRTDYRGELQTVKTSSGARVIPLSSAALAVARSGSGSEWLFERSDGGRLDYRGALRHWHKLLDDLNMERSGLHKLRHTYASQAIRCGISPVVLARMLGHSDSSFTLRQYCAADYSDLRQAAALFGYGMSNAEKKAAGD